MTLTTTEIAQVAHEANRALQAIQRQNGNTSIEVSPSWFLAPASQRNSAIDGVTFHQENPDVTPEQSHENWCDFKAREGWTYGPVKDEDAKTHPCLVAYGDLPEDQQIKDSLFAAIVEALS